MDFDFCLRVRAAPEINDAPRHQGLEIQETAGDGTPDR
jgi:hypothetical protein